MMGIGLVVRTRPSVDDLAQNDGVGDENMIDSIVFAEKVVEMSADGPENLQGTTKLFVVEPVLGSCMMRLEVAQYML
jgi:hypothetical protein